ncbi:hypothetical protein KNE206_42110 [Kitasatospora sp. NE20-6]
MVHSAVAVGVHGRTEVLPPGLERGVEQVLPLGGESELPSEVADHGPETGTSAAAGGGVRAVGGAPSR